MWKLLIFIFGSGYIIYISRQSLRAPKSHGFYRFFTWEIILVLFLLNVTRWFHDPLSWNQLIAWSLLMISLIPLFYGVQALTERGKPTSIRETEPQLYAFEKTTQLVTTGIYHYIRHPLYSSLLFLTWGIFFKKPGWIGLFLAMVASLFLFATAKADEKECIKFFGLEYQTYMKRSKRFVPFLF
jgi:protein-S-isoprenylcysteine O-methyltransferase Ste14